VTAAVCNPPVARVVILERHLHGVLHLVVEAYALEDRGERLLGHSAWPLVAGDRRGALKLAAADFQKAFAPSPRVWAEGLARWQAAQGRS